MKAIDKQRFPMTVSEFAEAAGTNDMRVYRMIKAGMLKTKPGRPVLVLGWVRKAPVPIRVWRYRMLEAVYYSGLPKHKWGFEADGTLLILHVTEGVRIRPGGTVWALEASVARVAELAGK